MNLFLAVVAEHKARTKHDVFTQSPLDTVHITCDVCTFLWAEKQKIEKEEAEFYQDEPNK